MKVILVALICSLLVADVESQGVIEVRKAFFIFKSNKSLSTNKESIKRDFQKFNDGNATRLEF